MVTAVRNDQEVAGGFRASFQNSSDDERLKIPGQVLKGKSGSPESSILKEEGSSVLFIALYGNF